MSSLAHAIAIALHLVSVVVWIGGMSFAYTILRPALARDDPARRLTLWYDVFSRFLPLAGAAVVTLLLSGYWLMFQVFGGFATPVWYIHLMHGLGWIMAALYLWLIFKPWTQFRRAVIQEHWQGAALLLNRIRLIVLVNLVLGLSLVVLVPAGRYLG